MNSGSKSASQPTEAHAVRVPVRGFFQRLFARLEQNFLDLTDYPLPQELLTDPECARHARLITRFGLLGSLFGIIYAAFYILIGFKSGALIVVGCSSGVAFTPFLLRWKKSVSLAGNFLALTLTLGFTALCCLEGGLNGHSIAWLVSVPLCALLLVGQKSGQWWAVISFLSAAIVAGIDLAGKKLPLGYAPKWHSLVSAAGYLGLVAFLFLLGLIFEVGRARAFAKMQAALADLASSNERLVHLNNEKTEFLGIAAHDLKNPLTAIVGSAEMLVLTNEPVRIAKLARIISTAGTRMRDLITDLLDANAIEQGKFASNLERCDIGALVEQSVESNLPAATRKTIAIRLGASEGLCCKADKAATMQILDNLVSNAVKYSPPNTTVQVHTLPEKDFILVSVRDEGPGISEDDQKKMFGKFTRLSARPTGGESSNGLGLSIVKKLAEAMSGTIHCHSVLGAGATFTLRLPAWPNSPAGQPALPAMNPRSTAVIPEPQPFHHARN